MKGVIGDNNPAKRPEVRQKISLAMLGNKARKGAKNSLEHKRRQSISHLGKNNPMYGKIFSLNHRKRLSESHKGSKSHLWKGGITKKNNKIRSSFEYKLWRRSVFERDDYTCRFCGERGGKLNADHIKPFAFFPELRFAIDNGRTLCVSGHKTTDTYSRRYYKNK